MKKICLLFICTMSLFLSSCSGDDSKSVKNENGTFSMKIDGKKITFDDIIITKDDSDPNSQALITVIASQEANPDTYVAFDIFEGNTGSFATTYFLFVIEGTEYFPGEGNATVMVNSNGSLKGNFHNLIQQWNTETESYDTLYTITEGSYDLKVN